MVGPTEAHREFFKGMHGNPERVQAFMADPRKALDDAGLDSSVISDEHHDAITGGGEGAASRIGVDVGTAATATLSIAAAF